MEGCRVWATPVMTMVDTKLRLHIETNTAVIQELSLNTTYSGWIPARVVEMSSSNQHNVNIVQDWHQRFRTFLNNASGLSFLFINIYLFIYQIDLLILFCCFFHGITYRHHSDSHWESHKMSPLPMLPC